MHVDSASHLLVRNPHEALSFLQVQKTVLPIVCQTTISLKVRLLHLDWGARRKKRDEYAQHKATLIGQHLKCIVDQKMLQVIQLFRENQ